MVKYIYDEKMGFGTSCRVIITFHVGSCPMKSDGPSAYGVSGICGISGSTERGFIRSC